MSSSKPRARAIVEGMAVCAAVAVCAAPGLGKVEAVGVTMGVAVSLCLFAWEGVRAPPRGATEEEEEVEEAEAEAAGEAVPGAWLQALRVEGAPDFSKFASDDENESNPRTPERLLLDDDLMVSIAAPATAPKAFARPVHSLSPAFAPPVTPSRRASVAASTDLKRLLNDLGLAALEPQLTAWGAKTPQDLMYMEDADFVQLGLTKAQGRLIMRKAADQP